jgi:EAL and modified HD-GYP domain-containing signal transduction protein
MDVFIARQPIFDRHRQIYAYELLFRSDAGQNAFDGSDGAAATTRLIANSLLATGLENLLCGKKAFINFDRSLLLGGLHSVLPPDILVIEVLETVEPDDDVLAACQGLCKQGYAFAMDDFVNDARFEPLARLAKLIKVDLLATPRPEQGCILEKYKPLGIAMLAEKVETREDFEWALAAGYDYFQGYFFARPEIVRGRRIPASKLTCLRLLTEVQQDDPDFDRLEKLISSDVSLCYSLLLYVNSALFSRSTEIRSVRQAINVLGQEGIRHWAVLAALPMMAKDKPGELITLSLVRARFCERIASLARIPPPNLAFLMGLFSLLDGLIDLPIEEALLKVHADPSITGALTETAAPGDRYRDVYRIARVYEAGDWDAATALAAAAGIKTSQLADAYAESAFWAQQALHATTRQTNVRRHVRHAAIGVLRLRCEDRSGRERIIPATLINSSEEGLQLQVSEAIPVRSYVSCNDPKFGVSGRGTVRYCNFVKGKFFIGVEFPGGTGWLRSQAST